MSEYMSRISKIFCEDDNKIPNIWFRGTEEFPRNLMVTKRSRFAYYTGAKPDPLKEETPKEVEDLYNAGKIREISYVSYNASWKISRTYSGMSNFGYGVYFATSIDWARRYGDYVTVAAINPDYVLKIDWNERDVAGSLAKKVMDKVQLLGGIRLADQASSFYKAVKSIDRTKKALFIESGEEGGQLVVYNPDIIIPKMVISFYEGQ